VQAGLLSRANKEFGVPTPLNRSEGNIAGGAMRESPGDPARSENLCMYGTSMRENRDCATRRCFVRMEVRDHHRLAVVAAG
jgi:hypothetical protein